MKAQKFCSFKCDGDPYSLRSDWEAESADGSSSYNSAQCSKGTVAISLTDGQRVFQGELELAALEDDARSAGMERPAEALKHTRMAFACTGVDDAPYVMTLRRPQCRDPELRWQLVVEGGMKLLLGRVVLKQVRRHL